MFIKYIPWIFLIFSLDTYIFCLTLLRLVFCLIRQSFFQLGGNTDIFAASSWSSCCTFSSLILYNDYFYLEDKKAFFIWLHKSDSSKNVMDESDERALSLTKKKQGSFVHFVKIFITIKDVRWMIKCNWLNFIFMWNIYDKINHTV